MKCSLTRSVSISVWILVLLLPALMLGCIFYVSTAVPMWDEWDTPGILYQNMLQGTLRPAHFFSQHNESRKVFPKLLFALSGWLAGWQVHRFAFLSWAMCVASVMLQTRMLPDRLRMRPIAYPAMVVVLIVLVFSPAQAENFQIGLQFIVFIPGLCMLTSLWVQARSNSYRNAVLVCAGLSLVSTLSYANGMVCWLLACPFFRTWLADWGTASAEKKRTILIWTGIYCSCAAVVIGSYFWDYARPAGRSPGLGVVFTPLEAGQYFLTWLGGPFLRYSESHLEGATLLGVALLILAMVGLTRLFIHVREGAIDKSLLVRCYPWLCLMAYSVIAALATTMGRMQLGLESAVVSRYSTFALMFSMGLVGLLATLWVEREAAEREQTRSNSDRWVAASLFALVLFISLDAIPSWRSGIETMESSHRIAEQNLLTLRLLPHAPNNPLLSHLHPNRALVRTRGRLFFAKGLFAFDPIGDWLVEKLSAPDGAGVGQFALQQKSVSVRGQQHQTTQVVGWAWLPDEGRPADFVILAGRKPNGEWDVLTGLIPRPQSTPETRADLDSRRRESAFRTQLSLSPGRYGRVEVFAVDVSSKRVYRLPRSQ